jgi:hypothetical protein
VSMPAVDGYSVRYLMCYNRDGGEAEAAWRKGFKRQDEESGEGLTAVDDSCGVHHMGVEIIDIDVRIVILYELDRSRTLLNHLIHIFLLLDLKEFIFWPTFIFMGQKVLPTCSSRGKEYMLKSEHRPC